VNRRPEVRTENAVDGRVSMTSSSMQANNDSQSNRSSKVGGTDEISVPQRPGLGLDPDRNVIRDYLRVGTDTRGQKVA